MSLFPDYLLVGHIAHDVTPDGPKLGGSVSYTGSAASALGANVAIVTSAKRAEVVLELLPTQVSVCMIEALQSTVFVNTYVGNVRHQVIRSRAAPLKLDDIPADWRRAPIVHLAPLDDEVDPQLAYAFPDAFCVATPQGWMRTWDNAGVVRPKRWADAEKLLPVLDATILSEEDLQLDRALELHYAALAKLLVVTRAAKGCTIYQKNKQPINFTAPIVPVIDPTGAGDVFAGVFAVMMLRTGNVCHAAKFAT